MTGTGSGRNRHDEAIKNYPTEPVEIVVEIQKCQQDERIGTERIFVLDPVDKLAWQWKSGGLEAITQL